jgi:hypothetical protein
MDTPRIFLRIYGFCDTHNDDGGERELYNAMLAASESIVVTGPNLMSLKFVEETVFGSPLDPLSISIWSIRLDVCSIRADMYS